MSAIARLTPAPELAAALELHTDRSPLAVTEVVRELAATGAIVLDGQGRWQVAVPSVALVVADLGARSQRRAHLRARREVLGSSSIGARPAGPARA